MGLKAIAYSPYKCGKTVFGLSMAEVGHVGIIDTEDRLEWYSTPPPTPTPVEKFPFDNPRIVRPLPFLAAARHTIYLVQTKEIAVAGRAIEAWTKDPRIAGIVIDSGSVLWDLLQDTRDDSDPRTAMLSWTPVKRVNRRLMYAAMSGGKHLLITAHTQEKYKKVGRELAVDGVRPWLEKKTPHWADLTLEFAYPDGAPHPVARVDGEGLGGQGGLVRGAIIGDPSKGEAAPTWAGILRRLSYVAPAPKPGPDATEIEYRNQSTVDAIGKSAPIAGVDVDGKEAR